MSKESEGGPGAGARTGFNAQVWLVDRHAEGGRGDHVAVRGTETLTYRRLAELTADIAAGLRSLGLRRDDRVMFVMNDDVPLLAGILGAFRAGLVAVPVSTMLGSRELGRMVADSGATVLVADAEYAEAVAEAAEAAPELRQLVVHTADELPGAPAGVHTSTWADLVAAGAAAPAADREPAPTGEDAWALWLYTSGTTGSPKAAMHRHANIRHVSETYGARVLGITPEDVCLSVAKLFFAYGIGNSLFFPLSAGATTVLEPRRPTPAVILERVAADRPTLFFGVPTFYASLLAADPAAQALDPVRLCTSAGEALPAALIRRFTERFGLEIIDGIGSTEALHIFLSNRPGEVRAGTTGIPVPGYRVELRDVDGRVVEDGTPGALHVSGESIAQGYWQRTDASRSVFLGTWLNTGDTYVRSQDGYFTCLGRSNDLIKAGGIWVSPTEVEDRLLEHPAVVEAAMVGVTDAAGLERPVACVVATEPVTGAELVQWCRAGLAAFKRPREVFFVDALPKTATGKIQRYRVRELIAARSGATPAPAPAAAAVPAPAPAPGPEGVLS